MSARITLCVAAALAFCFFLFSPLFPAPPQEQLLQPLLRPNTYRDVSAANATLGFDRIYALSRGTEWRLHGLDAAAAYTGVQVTVPPQPFVSPEYIRYFMQAGPEGVDKPSYGAAQAWIAHLDLLRHIVQAEHATALIVEDDVDWAVEIKAQMATLADKVRQFTRADDAAAGPYGSAWDILWLGHCGEWYDASNPPETLSWADDTAGPRADWRGIYNGKWLQDLPEGQRHMFRSVSPMCTYAYAVTAAGAQKILQWASEGRGEAYDVHLANGCIAGALECISVVDQLFHHYRPPPEFGEGSDIRTLDGAVHVETPARDSEAAVGSTAVVLRSARCAALWGTTCKDVSTKVERPY